MFSLVNTNEEALPQVQTRCLLHDKNHKDQTFRLSLRTSVKYSAMLY